MSHQKISFVKSGVRLGGYLMLTVPSNTGLFVAIALLVVSEIIGILEEIGHE